MNMILRIIRIKSDAITPKYAHADDSGMDLHSTDEAVIEPNESKLIKTGIKLELPPNTEAQIRPRSGLALKNGISVLNTPGTIDEGYRGEIGVILINHSKKSFSVSKGMRIAQMIIAPIIRPIIEEVKDLSNTERGSGGFGSTGTT